MQYMQLYIKYQPSLFSGKVFGSSRDQKTSEAWEMQSIPSLQPGYGCEVCGGAPGGFPIEKRLQGKRGKEPSKENITHVWYSFFRKRTWE